MQNVNWNEGAKYPIAKNQYNHFTKEKEIWQVFFFSLWTEGWTA